MRIIPIEKKLIPYTFDIELGGTLYTFLVRYNQEFDYYTLDLSIGNEIIVEGEKIVLGRILFESFRHLNVPYGILPFDVADIAERVGEAELMESVFLYFVGDLDE